ncbi:TPA: hypothetical protein N0F65_001810 [Lagenidium giganteum]|uniref:SURF1-like protein n=1 Tax=Lagenidium giganteum TaxID=4803 RepID=A0AAV2Z649_9STRA|nr:TPA: hypothetical protein N0F65_001810 [Lagenidium giganteum]
MRLDAQRRLRQLCIQQRMLTTAKKHPAKAEESNFSRYAGMAFFGTIVSLLFLAHATCMRIHSDAMDLVAAVHWLMVLSIHQAQRYFWKVNLIEERKKQLEERIVDLPLNAVADKDTDALEFRQLRVNGFFEPDSTYYLYPRSAPAESTDSVATPKSGGYIYSLLRRDDGTPVIVNRGWLPRKLLMEHIELEKKEEDGEVSIKGVLRHGEEVGCHRDQALHATPTDSALMLRQPGKFTPDNALQRRQFFFLDHAALARAMGVEGELPIIIDALGDDGEHADPSLTHPVRKTINSFTEFYMTPSKHAGYALTWFSFSLASAVMAYLRFRKVPVKPIPASAKHA